MQFCNAMIALDRLYPWKCVTVLKMLDKSLIELMSKSGCIRISLGIESFSSTVSDYLPQCKRDMQETFLSIAKICQENGIELNCFIILGLPGDCPEEVKATMEICKNFGARVRPTIYTPYHLLRDDMSVGEVNQFNRQLFVDNLIETSISNQYYAYCFSNHADKATNVMHNIPRHESI